MPPDLNGLPEPDALKGACPVLRRPLAQQCARGYPTGGQLRRGAVRPPRAAACPRERGSSRSSSGTASCSVATLPLAPTDASAWPSPMSSLIALVPRPKRARDRRCREMALARAKQARSYLRVAGSLHRGETARAEIKAGPLTAVCASHGRSGVSERMRSDGLWRRAQLWSRAWAESAEWVVAAQLPRSFSASSVREPGSAA
jgi:hypothetical protein